MTSILDVIKSELKAAWTIEDPNHADFYRAMVWCGQLVGEIARLQSELESTNMIVDHWQKRFMKLEERLRADER